MMKTSFVSGPRCENEDICLSSPCANGGICSSLSGGSYTCSCPPGYMGSRCLNDTNECAAIPSICQNEGVCINTLGSYKWVFNEETNKSRYSLWGLKFNTVNSIDVSVPWGSLANTVKTRTTLAHLHHAWMEAPAIRTLKPVTHATVFLVREFQYWVIVLNLM